MGSGELPQTKKKNLKGRTRLHWWRSSTSQLSHAANESMESWCQLSTQNSNFGKGYQLQFTKGWVVTEEVLDSLQLVLITTYPAIVRLASVPDPRQQPNLAVPRDKSDN